MNIVCTCTCSSSLTEIYGLIGSHGRRKGSLELLVEELNFKLIKINARLPLVLVVIVCTGVYGNDWESWEKKRIIKVIS